MKIEDLKTGTIVRHFKGNLYMIIGVAVHTETDEKEVVYKALYEEGRLWVRPIDLFLSKVPEEKENPTGQEYRFEEYKPESVSEYEIGD